MAGAGKYAADTSVSTDKSRLEIEQTLRRYKADAFGYSTDGNKAQIMFRIVGRYVRFWLTLPDQNADEFWLYKQGRSTFRRTDGEGQKRWEQACRQRWRALALVIKAKLEAVECGITTIEDEFLAHTLMPDNRTFGEWAKPEIERLYIEGGPPRPMMLEAPR